MVLITIVIGACVNQLTSLGGPIEYHYEKSTDLSSSVRILHLKKLEHDLTEKNHWK